MGTDVEGGAVLETGRRVAVKNLLMQGTPRTTRVERVRKEKQKEARLTAARHAGAQACVCSLFPFVSLSPTPRPLCAPRCTKDHFCSTSRLCRWCGVYAEGERYATGGGEGYPSATTRTFDSVRTPLSSPHRPITPTPHVRTQRHECSERQTAKRRRARNEKQRCPTSNLRWFACELFGTPRRRTRQPYCQNAV